VVSFHWWSEGSGVLFSCQNPTFTPVCRILFTDQRLLGSFSGISAYRVGCRQPTLLGQRRVGQRCPITHTSVEMSSSVIPNDMIPPDFGDPVAAPFVLRIRLGMNTKG
jgi:hypothetical protein